MSIKEWATSYPVSQDADPIQTAQPDLVNGSDDTRVSQIHVIRNKVHAVAKILGDNSNNPSGCVLARVAALEASSGGRYLAHEDDWESGTGATYPGEELKTLEGGRRVVVKDGGKPPSKWRVVISLWMDDLYGGWGNVRVTVGTAAVQFSTDIGTETFVASEFTATGSNWTPLPILFEGWVNTTGYITTRFCNVYGIY